MLMPNIVDGSCLRSEPSTLKVHIMDGSCLRSEPSTLKANIMDGSGLRGEPSTLKANIMDGSGAIGRTLHAERQYHGRFRDTATQILHMEATAGRQAGPFRSPAQSCRSVAAGGHIEATEKLYERHYLVIKIVSSFFACLIKFLYL